MFCTQILVLIRLIFVLHSNPVTKQTTILFFRECQKAYPLIQAWLTCCRIFCMLLVLGPRTLSSASNTFVLGDGNDCGMRALKMLANCGINERGSLLGRKSALIVRRTLMPRNAQIKAIFTNTSQTWCRSAVTACRSAVTARGDICGC